MRAALKIGPNMGSGLVSPPTEPALTLYLFNKTVAIQPEAMLFLQLVKCGSRIGQTHMAELNFELLKIALILKSFSAPTVRKICDFGNPRAAFADAQIAQ